MRVIVAISNGNGSSCAFLIIRVVLSEGEGQRERGGICPSPLAPRGIEVLEPSVLIMSKTNSTQNTLTKPSGKCCMHARTLPRPSQGCRRINAIRLFVCLSGCVYVCSHISSRSSADTEGPRDAPQIRNIALEKACSRRMTFKDTQSHYNCCY